MLKSAVSVRAIRCAWLATITTLAGCSTPEAPGPTWGAIVEDHRSFYDRDTTLEWAMGIAGAGALVYLDWDEDLQEDYQEHWGHQGGKDLADSVERIGDHRNLIPITLAAWGAGCLADRWDLLAPLSTWGQLTFRSLLVGTPPLLITQSALGGARPEDGPPDWDLFDDHVAASGHAFVGALPFLTASRMTENRWARAGWLVLSFAPGWARLETNDHYPSQVLLGWWISFLAVQSVFDAEDRLREEEAPSVTWIPWISEEATGVLWRAEF